MVVQPVVSGNRGQGNRFQENSVGFPKGFKF